MNSQYQSLSGRTKRHHTLAGKCRLGHKNTNFQETNFLTPAGDNTITSPTWHSWESIYRITSTPSPLLRQTYSAHNLLIEYILRAKWTRGKPRVHPSTLPDEAWIKVTTRNVAVAKSHFLNCADIILCWCFVLSLQQHDVVFCFLFVPALRFSRSYWSTTYWTFYKLTRSRFSFSDVFYNHFLSFLFSWVFHFSALHVFWLYDHEPQGIADRNNSRMRHFSSQQNRYDKQRTKQKQRVASRSDDQWQKQQHLHVDMLCGQVECFFSWVLQPTEYVVCLVIYVKLLQLSLKISWPLTNTLLVPYTTERCCCHKWNSWLSKRFSLRVFVWGTRFKNTNSGWVQASTTKQPARKSARVAHQKQNHICWIILRLKEGGGCVEATFVWFDNYWWAWCYLPDLT